MIIENEDKQIIVDLISSEINDFCSSKENLSFSSHALYDFYCILKARNEEFNLVSNANIEEFLYRHVLDSLFAIKAIEFEKNDLIIDIGSGAGFPGIPISVLKPQIKLISVESIAKKAGFQREIIDKIGLTNVNIQNTRAEELAQLGLRGTASFVVSRAVASLPVLIELSLPLLKIGGKAVFHKSSYYMAELSSSERALSLCGGVLSSVLSYSIPSENKERCLIIIEKTSPTPDIYPRRTGIPFKRPLF